MTQPMISKVATLAMVSLMGACGQDGMSIDEPVDEQPTAYGLAVVGDLFASGAGASAVDVEHEFAPDEPFRHHMGYAQQYREAMRGVSGTQGLEYFNKAVHGATSAEVLAGAERLGFPAAQLEEATAFLAAHHSGATALVSMGDGDLRTFLAAPEGAPCRDGDVGACASALNTMLAAFEGNLRKGLGDIKTATWGHDDFDGFINTQINVFRYKACIGTNNKVISSMVDMALEGNESYGVVGMNQRIRAVAKSYGFHVVELNDAFAKNAYEVNQSLATPMIRLTDDSGAMDCMHPSDEGHAFIHSLLP